MTPPEKADGPGRLTRIQWLICIIAVIGFAFDTYELLMLPLILRPALEQLGGLTFGTPEFTRWRDLMFYVPAVCGGRLIFKGTRIMVADAVELAERGYSADDIAAQYRAISYAATRTLRTTPASEETDTRSPSFIPSVSISFALSRMTSRVR